MFNIFKKNKSKIADFHNSIISKDLSLVSINLKGEKLVAQFSTFESKESFELSNGIIRYSNTQGNTFTSNSSEEISKSLHILAQCLLMKFDQAKNEIHKFPNITEIQDGETKGQEWLKVTNFVLSEAYKKASLDDSLLLEANIFIGQKDDKSEFSIRFQSYNLDYSYSFKNSGKILVNVYDDKNQDRGSAKNASYIGEFYNNRPIILDQMLSLISESIKSSNFRIFS